ncbi:MAG: Fic family protein [Spirochaetales bacterium]|nr:Fic family protein [Spirochaetales bacterium]
MAADLYCTANFTPPPLTDDILELVREIEQALQIIREKQAHHGPHHLEFRDKLEIIQASLEIEGSTLSLEQIKAILSDREADVPEKDITEILNTVMAYESMERWSPLCPENLKEAHWILMNDLLSRPGEYRKGANGISRSGAILHVAPPAGMVPALMTELFGFLRQLDYPDLIKSCIFHYEFEYIHPFADGNGRLGRLWHTLFLSGFDDLFLEVHIESAIRDHQQEYYDAFDRCGREVHSGVFVVFMLERILETLLYYI